MTRSTHRRRRDPDAFRASIVGPVAAFLALVGATVLAVLLLRPPGTSAGKTTARSADGAVVLGPPLLTTALPTLDSTSDAIHRNVFSVIDAAPLPGGGWVVLDHLAVRLHFLDPGGRVVRSVAGPGPGPDELERPLAVLATDTLVIVADALARRLDLFNPGGRFVRRIPVTQTGCPVSPLASATSSGDDVFLLVSCTEPPVGSVARLLRVDLESETVTIAARMTVRDPASRAVRLTKVPLMALRGRRAYIGVGPSRCLDPVYTGDERSAPQLCYPSLPRPAFPDSVRDALTASLGRKAEALGFRLEFPELMPPFERARSGSWGVAFEVALPDGGRALDLLPQGEDRLRRLLPPREHRVFPGHSEVLLSRQVLQGTLLRIVPLDG